MVLIEDVSLLARCRSVAASVDLPWPFSLDALVGAVGRQLGWRIVLQPLPAHVGPEISGRVLTTNDRVVLTYPRRAAPWFRLVTVCHELGHLLGGHLAAPGQDRRPRSVDRLLPDLQDANRRWQLYRCHVLDDPAEQEAELTASLLTDRVEHFVASVGGCGGHLTDAHEESLERVASLRRHWRTLIAALPEVSPWPESLCRRATTEDAFRWQQQRLVTEIYDASRHLSAHLPIDLVDQVAAHVGRAGLVGERGNAAADQAALAIGLAAFAKGVPTQGRFREPTFPGADSGAAARFMARQLTIAGEADVQRVISAAVSAYSPVAAPAESESR